MGMTKTPHLSQLQTMNDTDPAISRARAGLLAQELGLNDRPVEPASNDDLAEQGPWIVTAERDDGTCTLFLVELDEPLSMGDWALNIGQLAEDEVQGTIGHATHVASKAVLYFAHPDQMQRMGDYIRQHQALRQGEPQ